MRTSKQSLTYSGPAEVRGKYARPAGNIAQLLTESGEIVAKDNPVLSRPVTSGSLVARGRVDTGVQADSQPASRPGTATRTPNRRSRRTLIDRNRPMTAERTRNRTQSRGLKPTDLPVHPHEVVLPPTQPISDLQASVPLEDLKIGEIEELAQQTPREEGELPLERPLTATTWKTTTSQRRYIDELERLLKEERKVRTRQRRILAEAQLSS